MRSEPLRRVERILLVVGGILIAASAVARIHGEISSHRALREFEATQAESGRVRVPGNVDVREWSAERIRDYMESLVTRSDPPLAVLRFPKIHLDVPVFDGTDEVTLNRGAGRIIGTARLGEAGNVGIAAHRDGFFRGLKEIVPGDTIELRIPDKTERYVVTDIQITTQEDVSVLRPTGQASLTLVTCYPFYFVGSAPQRYIVRATIRDNAPSNNDFFVRPIEYSERTHP